MAKTQGQIVCYGGDHWLVRVYLGRKDGKRIYVSKMVNDNRKQAERVLREMLKEKDEDRLTPTRRTSLNEYFRQWLNVTVHLRVGERTEEWYRDISQRYVLPELGGWKKDKLKKMIIRKWMSDMIDLDLSPRTVRAAFGVLHTALKDAVDDGVIARNPCEGIKQPKNERKREIKIFTAEEASRFIQACDGERMGTFFQLALATACRPGELAALRWNNVDLEAGTVHIKEVLVRVKGEVRFKPPKTKKGVRTIPLPPSAIEVLRQHRSQQIGNGVSTAGAWWGDRLVFTGTTDEPLNLQNLRTRNFKAILKKAGLATNFNLYSLRHTAATLLIQAGTNPKVVSERLGHASVAFTMDVYVGVLPTMQEAATSHLEAVLFKG